MPGSPIRPTMGDLKDRNSCRSNTRAFIHFGGPPVGICENDLYRKPFCFRFGKTKTALYQEDEEHEAKEITEVHRLDSSPGLCAAKPGGCLPSWKFTHFSGKIKTKEASTLSTGEKMKTMVFGISHPRPENKATPSQAYTTVQIQSNKEIECWHIEAKRPIGTVILFHGYGGKKESLLGISDAFFHLGYNTLLVDFMGSGGSEGNQTTLGSLEAEEVKSCYEYIRKSGQKSVYLYGVSMGAAAVLKSIHVHNITPDGIFLECPFGSLLKTTEARFNEMRIPSFPMAHLMLFWGSAENGFWAFSHKPEEYAKSVKCPTLLFYGARDTKVSKAETDRIFGNLGGYKTLNIFENAGHENYSIKYHGEWLGAIQSFLKNIHQK